MEHLNPWLVTGLTDGEGTFGILRMKNHRGTPPSYANQFALALRADDKPLILALQRFFQCGSVYVLNHRNGCKQYRFVVSGKKNCKILCNHFDAYPLASKKHRDYLKWKELVMLGQVSTRENGEQIKLELEDGRKYVDPDS